LPSIGPHQEWGRSGGQVDRLDACAQGEGLGDGLALGVCNAGVCLRGSAALVWPRGDQQACAQHVSGRSGESRRMMICRTPFIFVRVVHPLLPRRVLVGTGEVAPYVEVSTWEVPRLITTTSMRPYHGLQVAERAGRQELHSG
jgi:hypothetical protein